MKREQIMKIFRDYSVTHGDLMSVADAILALPLDVPTIEEANNEANRYADIENLGWPYDGSDDGER